MDKEWCLLAQRFLFVVALLQLGHAQVTSKPNIGKNTIFPHYKVRYLHSAVSVYGTEQKLHSFHVFPWGKLRLSLFTNMGEIWLNFLFFIMKTPNYHKLNFIDYTNDQTTITRFHICPISDFSSFYIFPVSLYMLNCPQSFLWFTFFTRWLVLWRESEIKRIITGKGISQLPRDAPSF